MIKMLQFIIFFILFPTTHASNLNIVEQIEQFLDESAEPCDDLFEYTSVRTHSNKTLLDMIQDEYLYDIYNQNIENFTTSDNLTYPSSLMHVFRYIRKESYNESVVQLAQEYENLCSNNPEKIDNLFSALQKRFPAHLFANLKLDTNCTRASLNLRNELIIGVAFYNDRMYEKLKNMRHHMNNVMAYFWLERNPDQIEKTTKMFNHFKQELRKLFTTTKWIEIFESVDSFSEISRKLSLKDLKEHARASIGKLITFDNEFEECAKSIGEKSTHFTCLFMSSIENTDSLNDVESSASFPLITINNPFLSIFSDSVPNGFLYGTIGFTIAKEIGQIMVMNKENKVFLPYFSKIAQNCLQLQLNHTENIFGKNISNVNVDLLHPVVFAITFAYEQLRKAEGDNLHKPIEGSKLTNSQLFFFGVNNLLSKVAKSESSRDLESVLLHAGAVQIPSFKQIFKCSQSSKVLKSKTTQCNVFGNKAPHSRR